jgi:hypothetical protein
MSGLEVFIGIAGAVITGLVLVAMILITPRGTVEIHTEATDPDGSNLSPQPESNSGSLPARSFSGETDRSRSRVDVLLGSRVEATERSRSRNVEGMAP